ncbi:MaoC family dehydratase [Nocardioides endophyticus]|uniref:MaoC family dehydratase n=1 Tax=Nocardioides endophyticus TaxID=1353775 RepID=A0ABP8YCR0_9ACTN
MTPAIGERLPGLAVTVEAAPMKPMALLLRDPNPIHLDPAAVAELGLGDRVINQGPLNAAYIWEMLGRWLGDSALVQTLDLRFTSSAFAGDRLLAEGIVDSIDAETATCSVWLSADDGRDVVRGTVVIRLLRQPVAGT